MGVAMVARTEFKFHGRQLTVGDVFESTAIEAVTLRESRKATFAPAGTPLKKKRTYKRRDMQAEGE